MHLPDTDGFAVVRALRSSFPDCRCVVASGSSALDTDSDAPQLINYASRVREAGAVAYLDKPIDFDALLEVLDGFD